MGKLSAPVFAIKPADAERRVEILFRVSQKVGDYARSNVGEGTLTAGYPLDILRLRSQIQDLLALIVSNVDETYGIVPIVRGVPAQTDDVAGFVGSDEKEE